MLDDSQLEDYLCRVVPHEQGRILIRAVRASDPLRNVTNTRGNWAGTFPTHKTKLTNFFESWSGERALLLLWEYDPDVLEVWAQAVSCPVRFVAATGRKTGVRTVVDFLVLRRNGACLIDYKTTDELRTLVVESPGRWSSRGAGQWDQPPLREHCEKLGLAYQLLTEADIPHLLVRNVEFLRARLEQPARLSEDQATKLTALLRSERRITISEAIRRLQNASLVYQGHFENQWVLNLSGEPLALPDSSYVYRDHHALRAFVQLDRNRVAPLLRTTQLESIRPGTTLAWDGMHFEVLHLGATHCFLRCKGRSVVRLARQELGELLSTCSITSHAPLSSTTQTGLEILLRADDDSVADACHKLGQLELAWANQPTSVPRRTFFEHQRKYRAAEQDFGNGFIGLIDRNDLKGNRTPRTDAVEWECRYDAFKWLLAPIPRDPTSGFAVYASLCAEKGISPLSEKAFLRSWNELDEHEKKNLREGRRAAYPVKKPRTTGGTHLLQGPPEGDSPFCLVHVDHVQSNIFARRLNGTQTLSKPWFSIAIDAFTRLVLALWVSLLPPSHASVMMVLRDLVRRHGRLPLYVMTDGGKDFHATRVKQFLALRGCGHAVRPNGEPRFGNPVERLNLDIDSHLSKTTLGGNEVLKKPRMSSRSHDPRSLANSTVPELALRAERLLFDTYPHLFHAGLKQTPFDKRNEASVLQGESWGKLANYDDVLVFQTLARARKHGGLARHRDGIRLNGWNYYTPAISGHTSERVEPPLYDPEDPRYIMVKIGGVWGRAEIIDSQRRRLPPEKDLRFHLDEHIYLSRESSHEETIAASNVLKGDFLRAGNDLSVHSDCSTDDPNPCIPDPAIQPPTETPEHHSAQPSPISWRT